MTTLVLRKIFSQRMRMIAAVVFFVIPSVTVTLLQTDYWPFLDYHVFSFITQNKYSRELSVFGVTKDGREVHASGFRMNTQIRPGEFWDTLTQNRSHALTLDLARTKRILIGFLKYYNLYRTTSPELVAMRLYRMNIMQMFAAKREKIPLSQIPRKLVIEARP